MPDGHRSFPAGPTYKELLGKEAFRSKQCAGAEAPTNSDGDLDSDAVTSATSFDQDGGDCDENTESQGKRASRITDGQKGKLTVAQILKEYLVLTSGQSKVKTKVLPDLIQESGGDGSIRALNGSKMTSDERETEKVDPSSFCGRHGTLKRMRGILLSLVSSLFLSLDSYLVFYLINSRGYQVTDCLIVKYLGIFLMNLLLIQWVRCAQCRKPENVKGSRPMSAICPFYVKPELNTLIKLICRSLTGCASGVFHFYALEFLHPADVSVILFSNPVFVAFAAKLILKEEFGIFHGFLAVVAICGVVIVSKPPFLAGGEMYGSTKMLGVGLAVAAMLTSSAGSILIRLVKDVHFTVSNTLFGGIGLLVSILIAEIKGQLKIPDWSSITIGDLFILIFIAVTSFGGMTLNVLSFKYEEAGLISIVRSSEVIFTFLFQMISHIYPDGTSLVGAALVLLTIFLVGVRQYVASLSEDRKARKLLWWLLK